MPSASSRGWNPAPRHRPWPFRTTRNIVVTGLFTVALVAALVGVGTTASPTGPRNDAAGLTGNATDAPTTSADAEPSSDTSGPTVQDTAPSDTDAPQALPDDVAPPVVPIPLPGSRPLGTGSTSPGEPALPGGDLPVTPPPGFDELPPSVLDVPLPGSTPPTSSSAPEAATSVPSGTVALPLLPDPTRDEPTGSAEGRGGNDAPASTTRPARTRAPERSTASEAPAPDTATRPGRTRTGETSLQLPTTGLPTSLTSTTPPGWPLYGESTASGETSATGAPGLNRTRATLPSTTPSGWPLYGESSSGSTTPSRRESSRG